MEESTQKELESLRSSLEKSNATISELNTENVDLTRKVQLKFTHVYPLIFTLCTFTIITINHGEILKWE